MKKDKLFQVIFVSLLIIIILHCCAERKTVSSMYDDYPTAGTINLWLNYSKESTEFKIWSPTAEKVQLHLYNEGSSGEPIESHQMEVGLNGIWSKNMQGDLNGTYYTYQVMDKGQWLDETPGIYAQAVGVNGYRAMVLDLDSTDPEGWNMDKGPAINYNNEAIIYELHIRDMTIHPESGSGMPGKYLGLIERGTKGPKGVATGFDHLKEMGITHVHLLPTYDHYSIDESKLDSAQFNWGYDPQNYNVPEGSFSSDPFKADVRIKEFKQMVKAFHDNGIGVILDVVYNHTGRTDNSNFNLETPGYYYRYWENGSQSDASGCGNETASDRAMMRKFILESVSYWSEEYHLDGFRFDLMGIHDISTMNEVVKTVKKINPNIFIYGEGWTAANSPYPENKRALKKNIRQMPLISAFSDDIRDGIKGHVFNQTESGFVNGADSLEESVKFGIVGSVYHPQIDYRRVFWSKEPWANDPWQAISYVESHDDLTLFDKLKISRPDAGSKDIIAMHKLANAIVMTSQGTAFLHAGAEMLRSKNGSHNSYNLPDSVNQIDWNRKASNANVVTYYKNLIALRKAHPAFRMPSAKDVQANLEFNKAENSLISYQISNNANGDSWKNIYVIYNAQTKTVNYEIRGEWQLAVIGDEFNGTKKVKGIVSVPPISMLVAYQK